MEECMKANVSKLAALLFGFLFIVGVPSLWADQQLLSANDISANSPDQFRLDFVHSNGPGWIAVYSTGANGKPDEVIGYAPLRDGDNYNITVTFDPSETYGGNLFLVLLSDKSGSDRFDAASAKPVMNSDGSWVSARFTYNYGSNMLQ
jgi:hypothetical protein